MLAEGAPFRDRADVEAFERRGIDERLPAPDLFGLVQAAAARRGAATALRFLDGTVDPAPRTLDFRALATAARQAAAAFRALGVRGGDTVALLLPNLPETLVAVLGAQAAGVAAPINFYLEPPAIAALVQASGARVLVTCDDSIAAPIAPKLDEVLRRLPEPPRVVRVSREPSRCELRQLLAAAPDEPVAPRPDETVMLLHTGGTTGQPKFVPLSGRNLAATALFSAFGYGYAPGDRVLCAMPLFHVGGLLACSLIPLACGAEVVVLDVLGYRGSGVIDSVWACVERERVTVLIGPPTVMTQLADRLPPREAVPSLRLIVNGAASLPVAAGNRLADALGVMITEPWGLTEATLAVTSMPRDGARVPGSVGVALPWCRVKAVRVDDQGTWVRDCAAGEPGLLAIRGPSVFAGYTGLPERAQPWLADGWLDTGDLGRVDANGHVWVTGRRKDVIKRGGHGIDPAVIEEALQTHPAVLLAAAVGKPDIHAGEVPIAFVQLRPGAVASPAELLRHATARIGERAAVPKEVLVRDRLPLTGVGKIHKPPLRVDAAERALGDCVRSVLGPRPPMRVAVSADPVDGLMADVRVPAPRRAAVQAALAAYALRVHVSPIDEEES